jgi:hypothetical protein
MTDFADTETEGPCKGKTGLFLSVYAIDHRLAKDMCLGDKRDNRPACPLLAACKKLTHEQSNHDGTWAGVLFVNGKPKHERNPKAAVA